MNSFVDNKILKITLKVVLSNHLGIANEYYFKRYVKKYYFLKKLLYILFRCYL